MVLMRLQGVLTCIIIIKKKRLSIFQIYGYLIGQIKMELKNERNAYKLIKQFDILISGISTCEHFVCLQGVAQSTMDHAS
jgi:hypothetical protein